MTFRPVLGDEYEYGMVWTPEEDTPMTTNTPKHTPWYASYDLTRSSGTQGWSVGPTGVQVAEVDTEEHANLIVKAVNNHQALVDALKQAEQINNAFHALKPNVKKNFSSMNQAACAMKVIRAALKQVEEETS